MKATNATLDNVDTGVEGGMSWCWSIDNNDNGYDFLEVERGVVKR